MKIFKVIGILFMVATMIIDALELKDRFEKIHRSKKKK